MNIKSTIKTPNPWRKTVTLILRRPEYPGGSKILRLTPSPQIKIVWQGEHLKPTYHYRWEDDDNEKHLGDSI